MDAARNGAFIPSSSFLPLSTVPFELPTSVTVHLLPSQESSACFSDTALSLMWMSLARVRPTVSRFPAFESVVPSHGPLTTSRERTAGSADPSFCKSVVQHSPSIAVSLSVPIGISRHSQEPWTYHTHSYITRCHQKANVAPSRPTCIFRRATVAKVWNGIRWAEAVNNAIESILQL